MRKRIPVESVDDFKEGQGGRGPKPRGFIARFWELVDKKSEYQCWEWQGQIGRNGYGFFSICNWPYLAHRISFLIHNGYLIDNLFVLHKCDNPKCVNPKHLILGTAKQNAKDAVSKNRMAVGELNGMSSLRNEDVLTIRTEFAAGTKTMKQLANELGVHVPCIQRIIRRERWSHV